MFLVVRLFGEAFQQIVKTGCVNEAIGLIIYLNRRATGTIAQAINRFEGD